MKKQVAIIGAGLQARRRIPAIIEDKDCQIKYIIGRSEHNAKKLAEQCGAQYGTEWKKAVADNNIDIVLVLTPPDTHAAISITALGNGKDVLCEKPLAQTENDAKKMIETANRTKRILKCGFNHRHHPAILAAYDLYKKNSFGKAMFGRAVYGITGRKGIEKEWRSDPNSVGGGQLMEQGVHVIDLFRWFLGEIRSVNGMVSTTYWPIKPLEDNGFAILKTETGIIASLHTSLTQWINLFEFEIYGIKGYFKVQNLGGVYGTEKLIYGFHEPDKPFSYTTVEFRGADSSWKSEWQEFSKAVKTREQPMGNGIDGLKAMAIVNAIYTASKTGKRIELT